VIVTWDEPKRLLNLDKHGMDFAHLTPDFFENGVIVSAKKGRFAVVGRLGPATIAVIAAHLGTEAIAIISMRPASAKERNLL
jgi:uncharacterized protein